MNNGVQTLFYSRGSRIEQKIDCNFVARTRKKISGLFRVANGGREKKMLNVTGQIHGGVMCALRLALLASLGLLGCSRPANALVSDDFSSGNLNTSLWTFVNPVGDGAFEVANKTLRISVPAGSDHDVWSTGNKAARVMQTVANTDFEIEAKFESQVNLKYQMQGFIIEQDANNFIRYDVYSDGSSVRIFGATILNGAASVKSNKVISAASGYYLRVKRQGNVWTLSYSSNGTAWTTAVSFSQALIVGKAGIYAGNASGSSSPAFTAVVDYFFNTASPIAPEDGGVQQGAITINISGNGTVQKNPNQTSYDIGQAVELAALPSGNSSFAGWSGDLSGIDNPTYLTVSGNHTVTATFTPPNLTSPTISQIGDQSIGIGGTAGPITFIVGDAETPPGNLSVTGSSSNQSLVPNGNIVFGGSGANRTVTVTAASGQTGSTTVTVTVSDGELTAIESFVINTTSLGPLVSDDFRVDSLNTGLWTFVNPVGDGSYQVSAKTLRISLPAGSDHNVWATGNKSARVMQTVANTDFEIQAKFESQVSLKNQMQGFIIEQDANNFLRYDVYSDGSSVRVFSAAILNGGASVKFNQVISSASEYHLRLKRLGNVWTLSYSVNGTSWTTAGSFSQVFSVSKVGVYAGNASGTSSPAFTAVVDYVFNMASPIVPEDGGVQQGSISVSISGDGTVQKTPNQTSYDMGQVVELTALPSGNSSFAGWSGDVTGTDNPTYLTVSGNHAVTATFTPPNVTPPTISQISDQAIGTGGTTGPVVFTVGDTEVPPGSLTVTGDSSNQSLVPNSNIVFGGSGANRTVTVSAANGQTGSATITVTVNDGELTAIETFVVTVSSLGPLVSDDFSGGSLNTGLWTFVNPRGDGSHQVADKVLRISVPAGTEHNVWTGGNIAPRVMQTVANTDFEVQAKFQSQITQKSQMQGFIIEQNPSNFLRFDVFSDGSSLRVFGATILNGTASVKFNRIISVASEYYLRARRQGNAWTLSYSYDGTAWTTAGSFSLALTVSKTGVFAGNATGSSSPALTAIVDYVFNTASPIVPEDGGNGSIVTSFSGGGTILKNPEQAVYTIGQVVELTAAPDPGWVFASWSGDLSGAQNPANLTVGGDQAVHAEFLPNDPDAAINVWYGDHQSFGIWGIPQTHVNVLGNIPIHQQITSLTYRLNGGSQKTLTFNPQSNIRLARPGDFNAEFLYSSLATGSNLLTITASSLNGAQYTRDLIINHYPLSSPTYTIDWSNATNPQEVAQVVDGKWVIEPGGVRSIEPHYDRLIAFGDVSWTDYEVTVPITVHSINAVDPNNSPGVGVLLRWDGHVKNSSEEPGTVWWPIGAMGVYRWDQSGPRFQIYVNQGSPIISAPASLILEFGTRYIFKVRVQTIPGQPAGYYSFKVWPDGQPEPSAWTLQHQAQTGLLNGSFLLVAHYADASFGNVTITPLSTP